MRRLVVYMQGGGVNGSSFAVLDRQEEELADI